MKRTPPGLIAFILLACVLRANAAVPVNVLDVDLAPLIDQSAPHPERFAVNVPHAASTVTQGAWQTNGRTRIWTYAVRIPGAVSVSFHAPLARLPASARLTVGGRDATVVYRAADINRATLWGRPLVGDTLTFQLTVDATEAAAVRIDLDSLQAGYRGLSANVPDHPYYKSRFVAEAAAAAATCTQNYSCNATDANRGPAKATVAILIGNLWQCTGTLVNDTAGDLRPYVLTARHCETGEIGGGAPQAAAQVSIYWDAVAPCGGILPSLYSAASKIQSGAHTVVEQQDAWLIELDQPPVIDDPYYAGWDATGGVFTGGYSVHHALGGAKQYTGWNGQALLQHIAGPVLKAPYDSDFWGLVNSVGNVGAGASGGALFDPQNRVVGSASLAWIDNTGDGRCPVANPPAPTAASITAQYTAFSAVWASTRDASSTTGNATMQSVLDAGATGRLTVDGLTVSPMTFTASNTSPNTDGAPVTLTWDASWAQSCTATGGRTGDGWAGAKPGSGSAQVTDSTGGSIRYALTCSGPGHSGSAAVTVNWNFVPASVSLTGPIAKVMVGGTFTLNWNSNVQPCTASDGNSGDGWAGAKSQNGSQTLAADHLGVTTYTVTCGTGQRTGTSQVNVEVVSPAVTLHTDATRIRIDSDFNIWWTSPATDGRCDGSGGTPGWAQNTVLVQPSGGAIARSAVPGTFTYTMTCTGGGLTSSSSVTVEFVDEAPSISLVALAPTQEIIPSGPAPVNPVANLAWTSNQAFCFMTSMGPFGMGNKSVDFSGQVPAGSGFAREHIAGTYQYVFSCGGASASTSITWVTHNPTVTIKDTENTNGNWIGGHQYGVLTTTNALPCLASGGSPGDGWAGSTDFAPNNGKTITAPRTPGTYTYTLTCGTGISVGTSNYVVTVGTPHVTLASTPASPVAGGWATLTWSANVEPCVGNADGAGVNWGAAAMNYAASTPVTQATAGTYTYTITCGSGGQTASASTQVTFRGGAATQLSASALTVAVNTPVTLTWVSAAVNPCNGVGGLAGDGWSGQKPVFGSMTVTSPLPGVVPYALNCDSGGTTVNVTYTSVATGEPAVSKPQVTLTASSLSRVVGQQVTLTWTSQNSNACTTSGGENGDGWAGSVSTSGSMNVTRATAGTSDYSITCTGAIPAATADVSVVFTAAAGTGSSSSGGSTGGGGGGGGGAFDPLFLLALLALASWKLVAARAGRHLRSSELPLG